MRLATAKRAAVPVRHQLQADGLAQATDSPQGLSLSGLSPKQGPTLLEGRLPCSASGEYTS